MARVFLVIVEQYSRQTTLPITSFGFTEGAWRLEMKRKMAFSFALLSFFSYLCRT
jgi:hypothetical protein